MYVCDTYPLFMCTAQKSNYIIYMYTYTYIFPHTYIYIHLDIIFTYYFQADSLSKEFNKSLVVNMCLKEELLKLRRRYEEVNCSIECIAASVCMYVCMYTYTDSVCMYVSGRYVYVHKIVICVDVCMYVPKFQFNIQVHKFMCV